MTDSQESEWREFEQRELARGVCPYGGGYLARREYFDDYRTDPNGSVLSCGLCDCFGFNPEEVGK